MADKFLVLSNLKRFYERCKDNFVNFKHGVNDINILNDPAYTRPYECVVGPETAEQMGLPHVWCYIKHMPHIYTDGWSTQLAYPYDSYKPLFRTSLADQWREWVGIADGGNADTVDGLHAADFITRDGIITPYNFGQDESGLTFTQTLREGTPMGLYFKNNSFGPMTCYIECSASVSAMVQFGYGSGTFPTMQTTGFGRDWYDVTSLSVQKIQKSMTVPASKTGYFGFYSTELDPVVTVHSIYTLDGYIASET